MADKDIDYILKLGLDVSKLKEADKDIKKTLNPTLKKINDFETKRLETLNKIHSARQKEVTLLKEQVTLQKQLGGTASRKPSTTPKKPSSSGTTASATKPSSSPKDRQIALDKRITTLEKQIRAAERKGATGFSSIRGLAGKGDKASIAQAELDLKKKLLDFDHKSALARKQEVEEAARLKALNKNISDARIANEKKIQAEKKETARIAKEQAAAEKAALKEQARAEKERIRAEKAALKEQARAERERLRASKQPVDPDSRISYQARTGLLNKTDRLAEKNFSQFVVDPDLSRRIAVAQNELRKLKREISSTTSFKAFDQMRARVSEVKQEISEAVREQQKFNRAMNKGSMIGTKLSASFKSFALSFASVYTAVGAFTEIFRIGKEFDAMQAGILAASDSAEAAGENFNFLLETAKRLGTDVESGVRGFNRLGVSMRGAGFEAEEVRGVYTAIQEATATFGLSADRSNLVMLAMSQMASKGKISSEELIRQLSENLPIAMQAAEQATGKTAKEIYKMMENGELLAKDFLVPFGNAMRSIVRENDALYKAMRKLPAEQQRLNTAYKKMVNTVFQNGGASFFASIFRDSAMAVEKLIPLVDSFFQQTFFKFKLIIEPIKAVASILAQIPMTIYKIGQAAEGALGFNVFSKILAGLEVQLYSILLGMENLRLAFSGEFDKVSLREMPAAHPLIAATNLVTGYSGKPSNTNTYNINVTSKGDNPRAIAMTVKDIIANEFGGFQ